MLKDVAQQSQVRLNTDSEPTVNSKRPKINLISLEDPMVDLVKVALHFAEARSTLMAGADA